MADQTNKSTQGNVSGGKSSGQGSGASTKRAADAATPQNAAKSPANTMNTSFSEPANTATSQSVSGRGPASSGSSGNTDPVDAAKDTARTLVDQAKSTAGTAYEAVTDKATSKLEEQKSTVAGGLTSVAEGVRSLSSNLNRSTEHNPLADYTAQYSDVAARKLEEVAKYFENTDVKGMARDFQGFARRNPAMFLGGAFALGMLAARFLKSTPPHLQSDFRTDVDHQLPATGGTTRSDTGLGTTPGVM